ncbi:hypothetical protein [Coleofasciculus sp. FACHB-SPT36]|uniref:hypothetical protein n=1 Tax=Cyanophyceae TaxID=3028117 RepID=UPI00168BB08B|nr:hypothetical protein [Coleofasciculus sp. FACHB-SPT36]MBD2539527.1 hypothetical protein [Coleofasciculus sp. FACHB-SPT36]
MSIRLLIEPAFRVDKSTYVTELDPLVLYEYFGEPQSNGGSSNLLIAREVVEHSEDGSIISLERSQVTFKTGRNERLTRIIVAQDALDRLEKNSHELLTQSNLPQAKIHRPDTQDQKKPEASVNMNNSRNRAFQDGDRKFLQELRCLPANTIETGQMLITRVRSEIYSEGNLYYHSTSGRFVESPRNFWTIKIQPRAKTLRITVKGLPEEHDGNLVSRLNLKKDRARYSSFIIDEVNQIDDALKVIRKAMTL